MLKNKKGFTLVEILAAVTILGIISSVAIIAVNKIIQNAKEEHYVSAEENMTLAGQSYVQTNRNALPKAIGQKTKIYLNDLIAANYIEPIKDYNGKDCDFDNSYVQIFKYSQKDYSYSAYLKCNGTTEGSSSGDNSGDSSEENKPVYESIPNIPVIEAKIQADKNKQDKTEKPDLAYIKIKGNKSATTKILYYSYVIYKDGNEVYNTGQIKSNQKADKLYEITDENNVIEIKIPLAKYSPGKVEIIISTINIDGETATKTAEKILPDLNPPKCEYLNPEDNPALFKDRQWQNTPRTIKVKCVDGEGESGCAKDDGIYEKTFRDTEKIGEIIIADNAGHTFPCKVNVYIDKEAPSCDYPEGSTTWKKESIDLKYGCKDTGGSTCDPDNSGGVYTQSNTAKTISLPKYTIKDNAGNETTCNSKSINVYIDNTPPVNVKGELRTGSKTGAIRTNSSNWTKDTIWLGNFSATDDSPITKYEYSTNCTGNKDGEFKPTDEFTFGEGQVSYCIKAVDSAGNRSEQWSSPFYFNIDQTRPTCGTKTGESSTLTAGPRTITVACNDNIKCKQISYQQTFNSGVKEKITIEDHVGNTRECEVNVNAATITINNHNTWKNNNKLAKIKAEVSISGATLITKVTVSREDNGLFDFIVPDTFNIILSGPNDLKITESGSCDKGKTATVTITHTITTKGTYKVYSQSGGSSVDAFNVNDLATITVS